jgi:translation initiation factor 2 subunit 3
MAEKKTTKKKTAAKKTTKKKAAKKTTTKKTTKKVAKKASSPKADENKQPLVNIGLVGHVDHGKTTLTKALSGKWTDTHSEELKRGITIRLGYADSTFVKTKKGELTTEVNAKENKENYEVIRRVSFVDAPGHESLMATMLSGATIMDGALLLVAANETCPQPQTREHLMALQIAGIKNVVIIQNKIDLVSKEKAMRNHKEIKDFVKGTDYENSPIIPISAQLKVNIDALIQAVEDIIPTPKRDDKADPVMLIARSFDINKPGMKPEELNGGILGGAIIQGRLKVGDKIEIRPGRVVTEQNKLVAKPIQTEIVSAITGGEKVDSLGPGGSIAIQTKLDPSIVHSDNLTGNIVGIPGKLPPIWYDITLKTKLLDRVVGTHEELKVDNIKLNEPLLLNVNGSKTIGLVYEIGKNMAKCKLKIPLCARVGDNVTISRRLGTRFRLIGYGNIEE